MPKMLKIAKTTSLILGIIFIALGLIPVPVLSQIASAQAANPVEMVKPEVYWLTESPLLTFVNSAVVLDISGGLPVNDWLLNNNIDVKGNLQAGCIRPGTPGGTASCKDHDPVDGEQGKCCAGFTCEESHPPGNPNQSDWKCEGQVCGDGVLQGSETCEPPSTPICNASCQSITCPAVGTCPGSCDGGEVIPNGTCGTITCSPDTTDGDSDGTPDCQDACPNNADYTTTEGPCGCDDPDADGDGTLDCQDACPNDPDKIEEGVCGCGFSDEDIDGDGVADCSDLCLDDDNKSDPGICGCGVADTDSDGDGVANCIDNCPALSNTDQLIPPIGTCPDQCGYDGGDVVADGQCGTITCPATAACVPPPPGGNPPPVLAPPVVVIPVTGGGAGGPTDELIIPVTGVDLAETLHQIALNLGLALSGFGVALEGISRRKKK